MPDPLASGLKLAGSLLVSIVLFSGCAPSTSVPEPETASVAVTPQQVHSFMIEGTATVTSDEEFQSTILTIDVTKLDNSVAGSMGVTISFGDVHCASRRPFLVYKGPGESGNLSEGDRGIHSLRCQPFTPAPEFENLPTGQMNQSE